MRIWVMQVRVHFATGELFLSCRFFGTEPDYSAYKNYLAGQPNKLPFIELVKDYGEQRWFNDRLWILFQLQDVVINGNFLPNLDPRAL